MADHCASILPPWRCVCLSPASFERPVSDWPPRRPLCDCFEHAQNFTATMASMAMSERPVYHHWATKATVLPPFCLQRRPGQFCGRTMEAERSQLLCKGGITVTDVTNARSLSCIPQTGNSCPTRDRFTKKVKKQRNGLGLNSVGTSVQMKQIKYSTLSTTMQLRI